MLNAFSGLVLLFFSSVLSFLYRKVLGPVGIFYFSLISIYLTLCLFLIELSNSFVTGSFICVDLGKWFTLAESIDSHLVFIFDPLSLILSILVLFLTSIAIIFGVEYMYREAFINRVVYLLVLFATMVVFLFCVYDLFLVVVAWESIGLLSYLLVNFYSQRIFIVKASLKVIIFSRISDLFLMSAFFFNIKVFGTTDMSLVFSFIPFYSQHFLFFKTFGVSFVFIYSLLIALSGVIKAAQFFSHVWLPDAMQAPTPASALIHSSTLVVMGIYLIMRYQVLFEFSLITNFYITLIGAASIGYGAFTAVFQKDAKKLVAYSTISQMGYLVCGCGFLAYEEVLLYLIVHAVNKAFLFVVVGYSVHFHQANTDLRQMTSLVIYAPDITIFLLITSINLMGLPYAAGFFSKEFLVDQVMKDDIISLWVRSMWWISFLCTPLYMLKLTDEISFKWKKSSNSTFFDVIRDFYKSFFFNKTLTKDYIYNVSNLWFQRSLVTGRFSLVIWFLFIFFLMFFGEALINVVFSQSSNFNIFTHRGLNNIYSNNLMLFDSLSSLNAKALLFVIVTFTLQSLIRKLFYFFNFIKKSLHVYLFLDFFTFFSSILFLILFC